MDKLDGPSQLVLADAGRAEAVAAREEEVRGMIRRHHQLIADRTSVALYLPGQQLLQSCFFAMPARQYA